MTMSEAIKTCEAIIPEDQYFHLSFHVSRKVGCKPELSFTGVSDGLVRLDHSAYVARYKTLDEAVEKITAPYKGAKA